MTMHFELDKHHNRLYLVQSPDKRNELPALWLRERSNSALAKNAHNAQRIVDPWTFPLDLTLLKIDLLNPNKVYLKFSDDHETTLEIPELLLDLNSHLGLPIPKPWRANELELIKFTWKSLSINPVSKSIIDALRFFLETGLLIIANVPNQEGMVAKVADLFGRVRETNFGKIFDVKTSEKPIDLAYTAMALGPHTDCNYRDEVPGIQLLHCLTNSMRQGKSTLVDGLAVAEDFKVQYPQEFTLLTTIPVRFSFCETQVNYQSRKTIIELDEQGNFSAVHYSPRTDYVPLLEGAILEKFYAARKRFSQLLADPKYTINFLLEEQEVVMFDNHRLLHGRTAYDGQKCWRHLQGCYLEKDGPASLYRVLG